MSFDSSLHLRLVFFRRAMNTHQAGRSPRSTMVIRCRPESMAGSRASFGLRRVALQCDVHAQGEQRRLDGFFKRLSAEPSQVCCDCGAGLSSLSTFLAPDWSQSQARWDPFGRQVVTGSAVPGADAQPSPGASATGCLGAVWGRATAEATLLRQNLLASGAGREKGGGSPRS